MVHLDLFSGIGGFAYAADQVWDNVEHIFCDNDKFCRQVLKKHYPKSEVYDDIKEIKKPIRTDIITGGFPCQPFSNAGQRKGTDDNRYLWPEMLRVIRLTKPQWVIAENVSGLLTMQDGMVFEQICIDLEASGYEVQPFIIPAAGVSAPHKRDRVWICAYSNSTKYSRRPRSGGKLHSFSEVDRPELLTRESSRANKDAANASSTRLQGSREKEQRPTGQPDRAGSGQETTWDENWVKVAAELCSVDDGLSVELDGFKLSKSGNRSQQIKAYGNAIVPQVAIKIMEGIKRCEKL